MLIGVVSDTHNNIKNIDRIISLFNDKEVDLVIHTGDITNPNSLKRFTKLNCKFAGVLGNNDRSEPGLIEAAKENSLRLEAPPLELSEFKRNITIFHEPDSIANYLEENKDTDIVLHGHTHRYRNETLNGILFFNPGESAGIFPGKNAIGIIDLEDLSIERIFF
tara:strand:- start:1577 stop:2068 length:492 start_codon:yes stop_codon:yes gene_type:complete